MRKYFEFAAQTKLLIATFVGMVLMIVIVFPSLRIGGKLLDLQTGYSYDQAVAALKEYGEKGRSVYAWASPTVDALLPLIYVTFFAGLIYRFRPTESLWLLAYIPVAAGIWDLCEKAQITTMLIQYPDIGKSQVSMASIFTSIKNNLFRPLYQFLALALIFWAMLNFAISKIRGI